MNLIFQYFVFRHRELLLGALLTVASPSVFAVDDPCGGYSTLLYANDKIVLTICHGPYTKIDRKLLGQWQGCDDAVILIRDKRNGKASQFADCLSEAGKKFRMHGNAFMLKHFQTTYPGFESEPLLTETINLDTNKKTYAFEKHFPACTSKDIDHAAKQVNSIVAKPFNGETYFASVYSGFYRLRDCARSDPQSVLTILRKYQNSGLFAGEVAETLSSVTSEVELIYAAIKR